MDNEQQFLRNKLLNELTKLGYHKNGRKQRADKGQSRGAIAKPTERDNQSKMATYMRVKQRMFNKDQKLQETNGYGLFLEMDNNSFYLSIPARYQTIGHNYCQVVDGRKINHTTRRVRVQKPVDLEYYRFLAYKEKAVMTPDEPVPEKYWPELRQMLIVRYGMTGDEATIALRKRQINWLDLFCEFYYLSKDSYWLWDYEHWRLDYSFVPSQLLPEDFVFDFQHSPGSEEFHPEWAYKANERREQAKQEEAEEQQRRADQFIINMRRRCDT